MTVVYYPLIVHRASEGFIAAFPDIPGCTSTGATVMEAVRNAGDALTGRIRVSAGFYEEIPSPSLLDEVSGGPVGEEVARVLVPVEVD
ncbi:MAG: type II toxin-antitoxin system HicB family antitoxin [Allosphingosinicella sp.]|uniref:type II toxin-antitoxin system HicB family antitoxin n=1 Tax=Allosphingosinicella sp. TaxID=2823234 RepID=UPI003921E9E1